MGVWHFRIFFLFWVLGAVNFSSLNGEETKKILEVGPGRTFERIEDAVASAEPGAEIVVYPKKKNESYERVCLLVKTPNLTIRAADPKRPVVLDGKGVEYSGAGSVPRAIVQFNAEGSGGKLIGFVLQNAHNQSFNAAGVRISQANDVTISRCRIRANDMGIMSDGSAVQKTGMNQKIERCEISENGALEDAGFNHNLYLGGTSAVVTRCEISKALTGHNLKSRVHRLTVSDCFIHHAANRELDIVDSKENTDQPGSDALLEGNRIIKNPNCSGNKNVIHFGSDQGVRHDGTLTLRKNSIVTPFSSPVIDMSEGNGVILQKNFISDGGSGANAPIVNRRTENELSIRLNGNRFPAHFQLP